MDNFPEDMKYLDYKQDRQATGPDVMVQLAFSPVTLAFDDRDTSMRLLTMRHRVFSKFSDFTDLVRNYPAHKYFLYDVTPDSKGVNVRFGIWEDFNIHE